MNLIYTAQILSNKIPHLKIYLIGLLCWILILSGCYRGKIAPDTRPKLPGKVFNASDKDIIKLQKTLRQRGVNVITIGSDYLIIIPSSILFTDESAYLTWTSYATLNQVASFLKQFRKVAITITSYSNKYASTKREYALTRARAKAVGNYLWSQGIDSRLLFTVGVGSDKPIMSWTRGGDASPNSRVEITFREAII